MFVRANNLIIKRVMKIIIIKLYYASFTSYLGHLYIDKLLLLFYYLLQSILIIQLHMFTLT